MAEGRKMALIPIKMLDQMKKANLTPLTQPNKDRVVKEITEMFASLPTTYRAPANVLMRELEKYPHMIQWNPTTHGYFM